MSKRAKVKGGPARRRGRRRTVIVLSLAVVVLGGGGTWWLRSDRDGGSAGPRLAVDRTEVDLGYRRFDVPARVVFVLTNTGDGPLRVVEPPRVKAVQGCWPPEAVVGQTTIQPGQATTLTLDFMMHAGMSGYHEFWVPIRTNERTTPEHRLIVRSTWGP